MRIQLFVIFLLAGVALLGIMATDVHAQTCGLEYKVGSSGSVSPGGTFSLENNFTNSGSLAIQIISVSLTVDFGTFSAPSSMLPLSVPAGSSQNLNFDVQVPSSASVGNHAASATASFQCNESGTWVTPSISPLVISTTLTVSQSPTTLAAIGLIIIGVIVALVVAVVVLAVMLRRRKRAPPPPTQPYMPPPPPPGQTPPSQ